MERLQSIRKFAYLTAGGILVLGSYPHVFPEAIIKKEGNKAPDVSPPRELENHVRKIAASMNVTNPDRIRVFITSGFSSVCGGTTLLPGGAVLGLPRSVLFRSDKDIVESGITMHGAPVDWTTEEGKALRETLLPSTRQTNFSIAHELSHIKHHDSFYPITLASVFLIVGYHAAISLPKYLPPSFIRVEHAVLAVVSLLGYAVVSRSVRWWLEYRADSTAGRCNRSYALGGVELMKKRKRIEDLFRVPKKRVSYENFVSSYFKSHPPYSERLERLEQLSHTSSGDDSDT